MCFTSHDPGRGKEDFRVATMTQPAPGTRFRKTIESEVLPPRDSSGDAKATAFYDRDWEVVVNAMTKEVWTEHIMRVYRAGEKWERGPAPVDNTFSAPFTEEDVRARFGGGKYVMWLYGPPKKQSLVGRYTLELEGQPIINSVPRNGQGNSSDTVALEAMRMYANPEFMRMQMQMMMTAATEAMSLIKSQIPQAQDPLATLRNAKEILGVGTPAPNPMNDLVNTFLTAAIQKLLNPPASNSLQETIKLINDVKSAGLLGGTPKADLASTFASNLPMLVDRMVAGLHEFRLRGEAERDAALAQRGDPRVIDVKPTPETNPAATQSAATANGATNAAAAAPASSSGTITPEVAQAIIAQSHLHRLVMGIKNPKSTGQDMYDYLVNAWPEILDELAKMSKETLLAFFKNREAQIQYFGADTLAEVGDDPRLPKMIEDFLRIAKENAALETAATSTAGVV
jgi:hypothetical protein